MNAKIDRSIDSSDLNDGLDTFFWKLETSGSVMCDPIYFYDRNLAVRELNYRPCPEGVCLRLYEGAWDRHGEDFYEVLNLGILDERDGYEEAWEAEQAAAASEYELQNF